MSSSEAVRTIAVTAEDAAELAATVFAATGESPEIIGYHGRLSPEGKRSLACITSNPGIVGFELCVMLAGRVAFAAYRAGYCYVASDFVDDLRQVVLTIKSPNTEAVGRDIVYYWPAVELVD